jgi:hypothetical protein
MIIQLFNNQSLNGYNYIPFEWLRIQINRGSEKLRQKDWKGELLNGQERTPEFKIDGDSSPKHKHLLLQLIGLRMRTKEALNYLVKHDKFSDSLKYALTDIPITFDSPNHASEIITELSQKNPLKINLLLSPLKKPHIHFDHIYFTPIHQLIDISNIFTISATSIHGPDILKYVASTEHYSVYSNVEDIIDSDSIKKITKSISVETLPELEYLHKLRGSTNTLPKLSSPIDETSIGEYSPVVFKHVKILEIVCTRRLDLIDLSNIKFVEQTIKHLVIKCGPSFELCSYPNQLYTTLSSLLSQTSVDRLIIEGSNVSSILLSLVKFNHKRLKHHIEHLTLSTVNIFP